MTHLETQPGQGQKEILNPRHFYAAYTYENAQERQHDITTVISQARELGYPIRYWWLSDAMDIRDDPDRLIICVHHPSNDFYAGMDLFTALQEHEVTWTSFGAAMVEEYAHFGRSFTNIHDLAYPDCTPLFEVEPGEQ